VPWFASTNALVAPWSALTEKGPDLTEIKGMTAAPPKGSHAVWGAERASGLEFCPLRSATAGSEQALWAELLSQCGFAVQVAIARSEPAGSKILRDGERAKEKLRHLFYSRLMSISADTVPIQFADGRQALCLLATLAADPASIPSWKREMTQWPLRCGRPD
jgi:hypothetical protein